MIVQVTAPYFTAGIVVGKRAAPIVRYMTSWSVDAIRTYANRKGWRVVVIG